MANEHGEQIRIVQETVAGKEITFAHVMGGPAPIDQALCDGGCLCRCSREKNQSQQLREHSFGQHDNNQ